MTTLDTRHCVHTDADGSYAICGATGRRVAITTENTVGVNAFGLWYRCCFCFAGEKFGDFTPQVHIAVLLVNEDRGPQCTS